MELEEILEVLKEKYPEAEIKDEKILLIDYSTLLYKRYEYICVSNDTIYIEYYDEHEFHKVSNKGIFNNIIELKHYLDIEITWEDLLKEFKEFSISYYDSIIEWINVEGIRFYKDGTIEMPSNVIAINRSYWQIYNIIKNLVE